MRSERQGLVQSRALAAIALYAITAIMSFSTLNGLVLGADAEQDRIILSDNPKEATDLGRDVLVRPNVEQGFYLYVRNPAKVDKKVRLDVLAGDPLTEVAKSDFVTVAKGSTQRISFGKPAAAGIALKGPPFRFVLALFDDQNKELERRSVGVTILEPPQYVEVSAIAYDPRQSQLRVELRASPQFSGPPCPVQLELIPELIPGYVKDQKRFGTYRTLLQKGGQTALVAEKLQFGDVRGRNGLVYLTVDGYKRAFIFETTFDREGSAVQPQRVRSATPSVHVVAAPYSLPVPNYKVCVEVDHSPRRDVMLEVNLATARPSNDVFESKRLPGDREQHVSMNPSGPEGAFVFKTEVRDWCVEFDLSNMLGKRSVRARLLDKDGGSLVVLDERGDKTEEVYKSLGVANSPPESASFIEPPTRLARGVPLEAKARAVDAEAGIQAVNFFVGKPTPDEKVPPDARIVKGQRNAAGTWSARVPLPADSKSVAVSAQFVNGVGLSAFDTITIDIDDPATKSKEEASPGIIKGRVVRGELGQLGLEVTLTDSTGAAKGKTKTGENGTFLFKGLAAGKYKVASSDPANQTKGDAEVTVEAGKTATATIELFLRFSK